MIIFILPCTGWSRSPLRHSSRGLSTPAMSDSLSTCQPQLGWGAIVCFAWRLADNSRLLGGYSYGLCVTHTISRFNLVYNFFMKFNKERKREVLKKHSLCLFGAPFHLAELGGWSVSDLAIVNINLNLEGARA